MGDVEHACFRFISICFTQRLLQVVRFAALIVQAMAPKGAGKKLQRKNYDYSGLSEGLRVQVESEGKWYAADVVAVSTAKKYGSIPGDVPGCS